jgi:uncharacterized protein YdhG (YjbR/CyaY superfamily)
MIRPEDQIAPQVHEEHQRGLPCGLKKAVARFAGHKGILQFPLDEPMPLDLIERIVKLRVQQDNDKSAARRKKKKTTSRQPHDDQRKSRC